MNGSCSGERLQEQRRAEGDSHETNHDSQTQSQCPQGAACKVPKGMFIRQFENDQNSRLQDLK